MAALMIYFRSLSVFQSVVNFAGKRLVFAGIEVKSVRISNW